MFKDKKCVVVGGAGFIGSHLVDRLVSEEADVTIIDNLSCSSQDNINPKATLYNADIRDFQKLRNLVVGAEYVFNLAAIARTPWCIDDPILCYMTNVIGTLHVLEACRENKVKRVVLTSSNVIYAFDTPYRTSKEAVERLGDIYHKMYSQSVITLRNSNVYGKRQLETGPSPNVFASLRKSKRENGYLLLTGDGEQSRDYTHVSDIVEGNLRAAMSDYCGVIDLCTGINTSLNDVARFFDCPIKYISERPGDIKHIYQNPTNARVQLNWEAKVKLTDGIKDVLDAQLQTA